MTDQNVPMGAQDSTMGNPLILNALIEILRSGKGQNIVEMVHEAISKATPQSTHIVGMQNPIMLSNAPNAMLKDVSRRCVMPSTSRLETPITRVVSSTIPHSMPSTANMEYPSIHIDMDMHAPVRSTSNPSNLGSIRCLPPTPEQAALKSLIESQSRMLRLLPDTPETIETRKEILKQIDLCERTLLGSAGLTLDEQEINDKVTNVPIGASTLTPKTITISSVTTKGMKEVTILLTSEGEVLKDEMGLKFYHFIFRRAEQIFGNTIQMDWRKQANAKKDELFKDVILAFGNLGFDKESNVDIARKYIHSKRDNLRSKLTKDLRYPRPTWITDQVTWDELVKDAKFKRKTHNNPNYMPSAQGGSKRRLRDTTKATQARLSSIRSHKLGSGGYNSIRGGLVHQFQKEASEEDFKYALLHGSQGLRKRMLDRGEKLVTGHESEEAQELNSSGSEHEEELEEHNELFGAHNYSVLIPEPQQETILEFQEVGNKNNKEGVQCDEQSTPTIRLVPQRKRT